MSTETVAIYAADATSVAERVRVPVARNGGSIKTRRERRAPTAFGLRPDSGNLETGKPEARSRRSGPRSAGIYANGHNTTIANAGTLSHDQRESASGSAGTGNALTAVGSA